MNKLLSTFSAILAVASAASIWPGELNAGLRVRFDMIGNLGEAFFIDIPRSVEGVQSLGWVPVERPAAAGAFLPTLVMYCPADDYELCVFFDDLDYIAGVQVAIPVGSLTNVKMDMLRLGYSLWYAPAPVGGVSQVHWVNQQFFVSAETLAKSADERLSMHQRQQILYDGGVYVPHYDGRDLLKIPILDSDLQNTQYTEQGCIIGMGDHYYYNMTVDGSCDEIYPWFTLNTGGKLIGTGLLAFGVKAPVQTGKVDWFETPARLAVEMIVPRGPQCLYELVEEGLNTMHIYYIDTPWKLGC